MNLSQKAFWFTGGAAVFAAFSFNLMALAWTGPLTAPPGGNASAPINVSATAQTKSGLMNFSNGLNAYNTNSGGWTGEFNWPNNTAVGYGILVGSSASGYSQFENASGYYTLVAQSSNGINTNGNVQASDVYDALTGIWMSSLVGGNIGHKSGGGFGTSQYGCYIANNWTGGCSCPGFAPNAQTITNQNDKTGTWYAGYVCYGS
jgi:hypothetical protein